MIVESVIEVASRYRKHSKCCQEAMCVLSVHLYVYEILGAGLQNDLIQIQSDDRRPSELHHISQ